MAEPSSGSRPATTAELERGYWAVRRHAGVVSRPDLAVVRMWGKDPIRMLNGLITNDLGALAPGRSVYGAILTPKGRMISDLRVLRHPMADPAELIMVLPAVAVPEVTAHLSKYVPPMFARFEAAPRAILGLYGPRAPDLVSGVLGADPPREEGDVAWSGGLRVAIIRTGVAGAEPGFDLVVDGAMLDGLAERLGREAEAAGGGIAADGVLDILRVEAGAPRFGVDMTAESMPAEVYPSTGMMDRAVSFTKGCYTGQEVVVRIAHRGHVNRSLRGLRMGAIEPPSTGTPLYNQEGKEVGWTTSSIYSPMEEEVIGMAMLRREVESGTTLRVGMANGGGADVVDLPFSKAAPGGP